MALKSNNKSKNVIMALKAITKDPTLFLKPQPEKQNSILDLMQNVYKLAYNSKDDNDVLSNEILPELVLEEMDEEQIWQQLELRNSNVMTNDIEKTSMLLAIAEEKLEIRLKEDNENLNKVESTDGDTDDDTTESGVDTEINEMSDENTKLNTKTKYNKKTVVDDQFFKLEEMEKFLEVEESKEMRKQSGKRLLSDDDGIDYFDENLGDDLIQSDDENDFEYDESSNVNPKYKDFFETNDEDNSKTPLNLQDDNQMDNFEKFELDSAHDNSNRKAFSDKDLNESTSDTMLPDSDNSGNSSADEADDKEEPKSEFQKRQERLELRIREYEAEVLGEKPWQMKGEVHAGSRPKNSLLEEILEFESTVRPAPVITEETTRCLEDIIRQRIKDEAWDDVVRIVKPMLAPQDYRKKLVLDQSKSKESLAQIYEKDFQRELNKLKQTDGTEEETPKEHIEVRNMMHALFIKLDALSNFHYTPKPVAPEAKIITNTPAVSIEEVAPVGVSDFKLLAPEEVYRGPKYELVGKSERTRTDKKRALRKKKQKQRAVHKALDDKDKLQHKSGIRLEKKQENAKLLKQVTRHRNVEKVSVSTNQIALKSSKAFFTKLQDNNIQQSLKGKSKATKNKADTMDVPAKKIKL